MSTPKLRMVAGPNGSGKSTLLDYLRTNFSFSLGLCLNPDEVERQLEITKELDFAAWNLKVDDATLRTFIQLHALGGSIEHSKIRVRNNLLQLDPDFKIGYFIAVLCDFMRRQWLADKASFTFETVMSNEDKVKLLREARRAGYRTYLYYICTDSAIINRERVTVRVALGGHAVPADKIESRYVRSLELLSDAILSCDRAYLFDNSGESHRLVAEFENATLAHIAEDLPAWFINHVLHKS